MNARILMIAAITASCLGSYAQRAAADTAEEIAQKLTGRWTIVAGFNQGTPLNEEELRGTYAVITSNVITTFDNREKEAYKAQYTINADSSPVQIDMVATRGGQQAKSPGLIKYDWLNTDKEAEITIVYSLDPNSRPKTFESTPGSKTMMFTMTKRQ